MYVHFIDKKVIKNYVNKAKKKLLFDFHKYYRMKNTFIQIYYVFSRFTVIPEFCSFRFYSDGKNIQTISTHTSSS